MTFDFTGAREPDLNTSTVNPLHGREQIGSFSTEKICCMHVIVLIVYFLKILFEYMLFNNTRITFFNYMIVYVASVTIIYHFILSESSNI